MHNAHVHCSYKTNSSCISPRFVRHRSSVNEEFLLAWEPKAPLHSQPAWSTIIQHRSPVNVKFLLVWGPNTPLQSQPTWSTVQLLWLSELAILISSGMVLCKTNLQCFHNNMWTSQSQQQRHDVRQDNAFTPDEHTIFWPKQQQALKRLETFGPFFYPICDLLF